jgi:hypothetical protein
MSKSHTTKHRSGDGRWHENRTTTYSDGSSKTVRSDITNRNVFGGDRVESVTRRDSHGNSHTRKV